MCNLVFGVLLLISCQCLPCNLGDRWVVGLWNQSFPSSVAIATSNNQYKTTKTICYNFQTMNKFGYWCEWVPPTHGETVCVLIGHQNIKVLYSFTTTDIVTQCLFWFCRALNMADKHQPFVGGVASLWWAKLTAHYELCLYTRVAAAQNVIVPDYCHEYHYHMCFQKITM